MTMSTKIFIQSGDLSDSFRKLIDGMFFKIDGVLVEKLPNGRLKAMGKEHADMEAVKSAIVSAQNSLKNSLK